MPPKNTITDLSLWVSAAGIALAGTLLGGCGTTPGREEPLRYILEGVASPEGKLVAASTNYDEVALFDLAPLKFKSLLTRPGDRREKPRHLPPFPEPFHLSSPLLAFAPDGETLVAAGVAGHVVAWDVRSGAERYRTKTGEGIIDLAIFPDGHAFVTAGPNIAAWTSSTGDRSPDFPLPAGTRAMSIAVSPDSRALLVGLSNGNIALYDAASRELILTFEGHSTPVYGVAFSPDGMSFASTAGQYDPRLWRKSATGEFGKSVSAGGGVAAAAQPSQEQAQALGVLLWLLGTLAQVHVAGTPLGAPPLSASAEAQLAAAPKQLPDPAWCAPRVAFSPDGRYLASTASLPGPQTGSLVGLGLRLFVTDLQTGETKSQYLGACAFAFTPDSRFVITRGTATLDAPVFWDVKTLKPVA